MALLLDNCSLKGFGTGNFLGPALLVASGWLLLIPGGLWMVAIIHPQVAPETVNQKNFPGPQLRLPPELEEGRGGLVGGSERGGGWTWGGRGSSFHFFCSTACLPPPLPPPKWGAARGGTGGHKGIGWHRMPRGAGWQGAVVWRWVAEGGLWRAQGGGAAPRLKGACYAWGMDAARSGLAGGEARGGTIRRLASGTCPQVPFEKKVDNQKIPPAPAG